MKRFSVILVWGLFVSGVLVGCAPTKPTPETIAKANEIARTQPICSSEKECNAMWEAAQLWVIKNADMKIQTANNVLIETYRTAGNGMNVMARVTKEPLGGGRYTFELLVGCSNSIGCNSEPIDLRLSFNRALNKVR